MFIIALLQFLTVLKYYNWLAVKTKQIWSNNMIHGLYRVSYRPPLVLHVFTSKSYRPPWVQHVFTSKSNRLHWFYMYSQANLIGRHWFYMYSQANLIGRHWFYMYSQAYVYTIFCFLLSTLIICYIDINDTHLNHSKASYWHVRMRKNYWDTSNGWVLDPVLIGFCCTIDPSFCVTLCDFFLWILVSDQMPSRLVFMTVSLLF